MQLKTYPKYRDSGIQWIGEIPERWGIRKLKYNYDIIGKTNIPASEGNEEDDFPFFTSGESIKYIGKPDINGEYIIVGDGGIPNFKYYKGEFSYSDHCFLLKTNKKTFTKFLYYFLIGNIETLDILCFHGMGLRNLDKYKFNSFFSNVPPLYEQTTIAKFLDKKIAEIDELIEKDKKLIELLKEKRIALINHAVTKGLDPNVKMKKVNLLICHESPENWKIIRIKFAMRLSRGVDLSNDNFKEGNIPVYGSNGIIGYHNKATSKGPGVTVGRSGSVGEVNFISDERYWAHNTSLFLQENYGNNVRYIYYLLLVLDLKHLAAGSAVGTLNRNYIHDLFLSLSTKSEQQKIVDYLDKAIAKIDKTIQKIKQKIALLEEYKKSLIHHTVTGKIDVRGSEI